MAQQYFKVVLTTQVIIPARNPGDAESDVGERTLENLEQQIKSGEWAGTSTVASVTHIPREDVPHQLDALGQDPDFYAPDIVTPIPG